MKIAIIVWDLSVSGGTQRQAIELARNFSRDHQVTVFSYGFNPERCYPELVKDLRIISLVKDIPKVKRSPKTGKLAQLFYDSYTQFHTYDKEILALANLINEEFDVLNPHDLFTERVTYYYKKRFPSVLTVWMSNDVPGIFQIREHAKLYPRKVGSWKGTVSIALQKCLFWLEEKRELRFVKAIDEAVVLDKRNQRQFKEYMHKTAKIVRSGLDLDKFKPKYTKHNKTFTLLGTGIMFRLRRFEDLIDAMNLLIRKGHKVELHIVGSDEFDPVYARELKDQVATLKLTKAVIFLGKVSEKALQEEYKNADVFVFPNHHQTWGLAVFEAMASATPVVVSRTAGAHEVLTENVNALLIDPLQPQQIAAKIEMLLKDPKLRDQLAKKGRIFVEENMSWPRYAEHMMEVFADVKA